MNYLIKLQMIIAKTIAGLIKITIQDNSRAIQHDVSRNDVNNENMQKPSSTKQVYIAVDR